MPIELFKTDDLTPSTITPQHVFKRAISANSATEWELFGISALENLSPEVVLAATLSLMRRLPPNEYDQIKGEFLDNNFGPPLPHLISPMDEARWWAKYASVPEREAFCIVCYQAMSSNRQLDFRRAVAQ